MVDMDRNAQFRRRGFSLIELLIVVAIILIIAMVAIPKMNVQLMSAREMGAIREITAIHQAETQYYSQFGRYAQSLAELGPPQRRQPGPAAADLLPSSLTNGKKGGHIFTVAATQTGYAVSVVPEQFGSSGRRLLLFRPDAGSSRELVRRAGHGAEPDVGCAREATGSRG